MNRYFNVSCRPHVDMNGILRAQIEKILQSDIRLLYISSVHSRIVVVWYPIESEHHDCCVNIIEFIETASKSPPVT
jgi:hypothetical protein